MRAVVRRRSASESPTGRAMPNFRPEPVRILRSSRRSSRAARTLPGGVSAWRRRRGGQRFDLRPVRLCGRVERAVLRHRERHFAAIAPRGREDGRQQVRQVDFGVDLTDDLAVAARRSRRCWLPVSDDAASAPSMPDGAGATQPRASGERRGRCCRRVRRGRCRGRRLVRLRAVGAVAAGSQCRTLRLRVSRPLGHLAAASGCPAGCRACADSPPPKTRCRSSGDRSDRARPSRHDLSEDVVADRPHVDRGCASDPRWRDPRPAHRRAPRRRRARWNGTGPCWRARRARAGRGLCRRRCRGRTSRRRNWSPPRNRCPSEPIPGGRATTARRIATPCRRAAPTSKPRSRVTAGVVRRRRRRRQRPSRQQASPHARGRRLERAADRSEDAPNPGGGRRPAARAGHDRRERIGSATAAPPRRRACPRNSTLLRSIASIAERLAAIARLLGSTARAAPAAAVAVTAAPSRPAARPSGDGRAASAAAAAAVRCECPSGARRAAPSCAVTSSMRWLELAGQQIGLVVGRHRAAPSTLLVYV